MNFNTALDTLNNAFSDLINQDEKDLLITMLANANRGTKAYDMLKDLLTNDFDCDNSGYLVSNLEERHNPVYSKSGVIALAKVLASVPPAPADVEHKECIISSAGVAQDVIGCFTYGSLVVELVQGNIMSGSEFLLAWNEIVSEGTIVDAELPVPEGCIRIATQWVLAVNQDGEL